MLLAVATSVQSGCGGGGRPDVVPRDREPLPDGEGVYQLRYNPPPCLADQPELHAELRTPAGWERVALETAGEVGSGDRVTALLTRFGRSPTVVIPVLGTLTNRVRTWTGQHASRVFVVEVIDPPVEPSEASPAG